MSGDYTTLPVEEKWVPYQRTRLPYSFKQIQGISNFSKYQLDEPVLIEDTPFPPYTTTIGNGVTFST